MTRFTPQDFQGAIARINKALAEPVTQGAGKVVDNIEATGKVQLETLVNGLRAAEQTLGPVAGAANPAEAFSAFEALGRKLGKVQEQAMDETMRMANSQIAEGFAFADQLVEAGTTVLRESLDLVVNVSEAALGFAFRSTEPFTEAARQAA